MDGIGHTRLATPQPSSRAFHSFNARVAPMDGGAYGVEEEEHQASELSRSEAATRLQAHVRGQHAREQRRLRLDHGPVQQKVELARP